MHRWEFYVTVPNNFLAVNSISLKVQENNSVWQTQVLPPLSNLSVHQWVEQSLSWWQLGDLCGACLFVFNWCAHSRCSVTVYDYMPKGVQEKRTEVLENKVDGMWVSNKFFEWTHVKSSTSEGRRQCCSSFLRNLTFSVICDKMLNITHYNKPTSLCC